MVSTGEGEASTAPAGVAVGLAAIGEAVGLRRGVEGVAGVGVAAGAGAESGAEPEVDAGVVVLGGVAIRACAAAGTACTWGATGAVEIGRSALASNASPQPGQKWSSLP